MGNEAARDGRRKLPTGHQLRAALRCARLIDDAGVRVEQLRESYRLVPYGGLYRSDDLIAAEGLLADAGLLMATGSNLVPVNGLTEIAQASETDGCEAILAALLERVTPLWLLAATSEGVLADELIPDEESHSLSSVLDPERREALLLAIGRRFSDSELTLTGAIAEDFVVAQCYAELVSVGEPELAQRVRRVSEVSDQLGYDITAPRLDNSTRRIEVKGHRGDGVNFVMYLSRNEAERGLIDPSWALVACHIGQDDNPSLVGYVLGYQLESFLPVDRRPEARWQNVRLEFPRTFFSEGLPPILCIDQPVDLYTWSADDNSSSTASYLDPARGQRPRGHRASRHHPHHAAVIPQHLSGHRRAPAYRPRASPPKPSQRRHQHQIELMAPPATGIVAP